MQRSRNCSVKKSYGIKTHGHTLGHLHLNDYMCQYLRRSPWFSTRIQHRVPLIPSLQGLPLTESGLGMNLDVFGKFYKLSRKDPKTTR